MAGPASQLTTPVVEPAAFKQSRARIATDGEGFLTVWVEGSSSRGAIHGVRLLADGTRIGETLEIAAAPSCEPGADVAFGGGRYPRPSPHEKSFGTSGSTIVYARPTGPAHDLLSRVFMRELHIVADPPRRRAVR